MILYYDCKGTAFHGYSQSLLMRKFRMYPVGRCAEDTYIEMLKDEVIRLSKAGFNTIRYD